MWTWTHMCCHTWDTNTYGCDMRKVMSAGLLPQKIKLMKAYRNKQTAAFKILCVKGNGFSRFPNI